MSGGSKHCAARPALPPLVLGTFKLSVLTATVTELKLLTDIEINKGNTKKGQSEKSFTWLTCACEAIDHVPTDAIIHTWVALTVIYVNLTVSPHVAWKTEIQSVFTIDVAVSLQIYSSQQGVHGFVCILCNGERFCGKHFSHGRPRFLTLVCAEPQNEKEKIPRASALFPLY